MVIEVRHGDALAGDGVVVEGRLSSTGAAHRRVRAAAGRARRRSVRGHDQPRTDAASRASNAGKRDDARAGQILALRSSSAGGGVPVVRTVADAPCRRRRRGARSAAPTPGGQGTWIRRAPWTTPSRHDRDRPCARWRSRRRSPSPWPSAGAARRGILVKGGDALGGACEARRQGCRQDRHDHRGPHVARAEWEGADVRAEVLALERHRRKSRSPRLPPRAGRRRPIRRRYAARSVAASRDGRPGGRDRARRRSVARADPHGFATRGSGAAHASARRRGRRGSRRAPAFATPCGAATRRFALSPRCLAWAERCACLSATTLLTVVAASASSLGFCASRTGGGGASPEDKACGRRSRLRARAPRRDGRRRRERRRGDRARHGGRAA